MGRPSLPRYSKPPVVEAYCGFYFRDLALTVPQLGAFWATVRKKFPATQNQPLAAPLFMQDQPGILVIQNPADLPRTWLISEDQSILLQIQKDRIFLNWRKLSDGNSYPSYGELNKQFKWSIERFTSFLREHELEEIAITGIEMGYVNIMRIGREFSSFVEAPKLFPFLYMEQCDKKTFGVINGINVGLSFELPEDRGNLFANVAKANDPQDGQPVVKFDLFARKVAMGIEREFALEWLDRAHETVVTSFRKITNETIQRDVWERKP